MDKQMKLYTIISDVDGVEVSSHYPSLDAAIKEWRFCMEECSQKERLQMEFYAKGQQAAIDEFDYDELWRNGREVVDDQDISDMPQVKQLVEALEDLLGDGPDTHEVDGRYECRHCGREWSAMCGDNEVPENCPSDDCPGYIARQALNAAKA